MNRNLILSIYLLVALFLCECLMGCTKNEIVVPGTVSIKVDTGIYSIEISNVTSTDTTIQFTVVFPELQPLTYHVMLGNNYLVYNQSTPQAIITGLKPDKHYDFHILLYQGEKLIGDANITLQTTASFNRFDKFFNYRDYYRPGTVIATGDGGFLFTSFRSFNNTWMLSYPDLPVITYAMVTKTDSAGNETWNKFAKFYGRTPDLNSLPILSLPNGEYLIVGDCFFLHLDAFGRELSKKQFDYENFPMGISNATWTRDGHVVAVGITLDNYQPIPFIAGFDLAGNRIWSTPLSGLGWHHHEAVNVLEMDNGDYLLYGTRIIGNGQAASPFSARITADGQTVKWQKEFPVLPDVYHFPKSVIKSQDGSYFLHGYYTIHTFAGYNSYVQKITPQGELLYTITIPDMFNSSLSETKDGGCVVAGIDNSPSRAQYAALAKLDALGHTTWYHRYREPYGWTHANGVAQAQDGGYAVLGSALGVLWFFKTDLSGLPSF